MKKFLLLSATICFQTVFSQVTVSGNKLVKDGQTYKMSKYKDVFSNQEAQQLFQKSRSNNTVGQVFAGLGGGVMGFGLARALSGGEGKVVINGQTHVVEKDNSGAWAAVGIGAGIVGIGIPFVIAANKNAKKALEIENGGSTAFKPYFKLETAGNGMALSYNF